MIFIADYLGKHANDATLTTEIVNNASELLERVNRLLAEPGCPPFAGINSGWRPAWYNAKLATAARKSLHMDGKAIDLDDDDGELDEWCHSNQAKLAALGLWLEHPAATKGWCHLQSVGPKSGRRVFYP
jgi:hypothetical protein